MYLGQTALILIITVGVGYGEADDPSCASSIEVKQTTRQIKDEIHDVHERLDNSELTARNRFAAIEESQTRIESKIDSIIQFQTALGTCKPRPNALLRHLPKRAFTASGSCCPERPDFGNMGPECSRFGAIVAGCATQGWPGRGTPQWIQVDLGLVHSIASIGTKGRGPDTPHPDQWVSSYKLASNDDRGLEYYNEGEVFRGNYDSNTEVKNELCPHLMARRVRLYPLSGARNGAMLRWELYGFRI